MKAEAQFAPAAFSYQHSESKQTAHATIGKGEIIVRNDPNASLSGLNRDVANAMTEKTTANVNIKLDPMFEYVDAVIAAKDVPYTINEVFRFEHDPGTFLKDAWQNFVNNLPWNAGKKKEDTPPCTVCCPSPVHSSGGEITMNIPKYMYIVILCYCVLLINGCGGGELLGKEPPP